jgi:hypothetical protein
MGFDEIFENNRRHQGNYKESNYRDDNRYSPDSNNENHKNAYQEKWSAFLEKIKHDKKLKRLVILAGILILIVIVTLIIVLMPVIIKLINYISQNGLQGLLDSITGFADKILKGSGK